jgi:hypothetical protein
VTVYGTAEAVPLTDRAAVRRTSNGKYRSRFPSGMTNKKSKNNSEQEKQEQQRTRKARTTANKKSKNNNKTMADQQRKRSSFARCPP